MNYFQITAFVNKLKTNSMNTIKTKDSTLVVIDNSPIREGYCLNINNNEVVYYNGNYGDEAPYFLKKITHSFPHLSGTIEIKQNKTMSTINELKSQLKYWEDYEPVNNMGKYARQTKIDNLTQRISDMENPFSNDPNDLTVDAYNENSMLNEYYDAILKHDYSYEYSDDMGYWRAGKSSERRIVELVHALCGIIRCDAERLLEDSLTYVSEGYADGLTHRTIRNWFTNFVNNEE